MKGYRQAAAALHDMNGDDRAWLLGELDDGARATLEGLMRELDELGFAAATGPDRDVAGGPAAPAPGPRERVALASAQDVAAVLEREPVLLVAQLLNAHDWPWTEPFLTALPAPRRIAVGAAREAVRAAPARDRCLVEQLAVRLGRPTVHAEVRTAPNVSIVERVRRWIR
jgi:hypothetical protein